MSCARCGGKLAKPETAWALPGWPNPWHAQSPMPFHAFGCPEAPLTLF